MAEFAPLACALEDLSVMGDSRGFPIKLPMIKIARGDIRIIIAPMSVLGLVGIYPL